MKHALNKPGIFVIIVKELDDFWMINGSLTDNLSALKTKWAPNISISSWYLENGMHNVLTREKRDKLFHVIDFHKM